MSKDTTANLIVTFLVVVALGFLITVTAIAYVNDTHRVQACVQSHHKWVDGNCR